MKRKHRPEDAPEIRRLFEAARRNTESAPRKHHLVPNMYLRTWAESGRLRVTEVDTKRSWLTSPAKAGRITDFYRLEHDDIDPDDLPPLLFETMLSKLEAEAVPGLNAFLSELPTGGAVQVRYPPEQMLALANFIAFQALRGRRFRDGQRSFATEGYKLLYAHLVDREALEEELSRRLGRPPTPEEIDVHHGLMVGLAIGEIEVGPVDAAATAAIGQMAQEIVPYIIERSWRVYSANRALITGDEPVLVLGGPGSPRTEVAGFATAAVLAMPLGPHALLAMFRPDVPLSERGVVPKLDGLEVGEMNREMVGNASAHVFELPDSKVGRRCAVPRWPSVTDSESGYSMVDDPDADVHRFYKRTRWAGGSPVPEWPVNRWWDLASLPIQIGPRRSDFRLW